MTDKYDEVGNEYEEGGDDKVGDEDDEGGDVTERWMKMEDTYM